MWFKVCNVNGLFILQAKYSCLHADLQHNFEKIPSDTQELPYDYGSVMHYGSNDFSIHPGDSKFDTIVPKKSDAKIGQRVGLSETDWKHLNKAYCGKPAV